MKRRSFFASAAAASALTAAYEVPVKAAAARPRTDKVISCCGIESFIARVPFLVSTVSIDRLRHRKEPAIGNNPYRLNAIVLGFRPADGGICRVSDLGQSAGTGTEFQTPWQESAQAAGRQVRFGSSRT